MCHSSLPSVHLEVIKVWYDSWKSLGISLQKFNTLVQLLHYILNLNVIILNDISNLVLLDTIYGSLLAKMLLKIQTVWVFVKIISIPMRNYFLKWPSGAPLILCQNYMTFLLVL